MDIQTPRGKRPEKGGASIEEKTAWIEALESGEYTQCKGTLRGESGFCCLGVYLDNKGIELSIEKVDEDGRLFEGSQDKYELCLDDLGYSMKNDGVSMNDDGDTFKAIAAKARDFYGIHKKE
jgi:hypothetical protein